MTEPLSTESALPLSDSLENLGSIQGEDLVHLHVHSEYSLLDGSIKIKDLLARIAALGHKAVAITDHGNLFGAIEFYVKAKEKGLKPIIGSEIFHAGLETTAAIAKAAGHTLPTAGAFHLVLLVKNHVGYRNLIRMVSDGFLKVTSEVPILPDASLDTGEGLIALSGCLKGEFGYLTAELRRLTGHGALALDPDPEHPAFSCAQALKAHVEAMVGRFGKGQYYVELIDNNLPAQKALLPDLVTAARHFDLPLVASCDAHYLDPQKAEGHAVLIGIKHALTMSKLRGRRKNTRFHIFDNEEMLQIYRAWPEALRNTAKIAAECNLELKFGQYFLPKFDTGSDETAEIYMRRRAHEMLEGRFVNLRQLYGASFDEERQDFYRKRLDYELDVISNMGFPGYFLIVQDFINWAKSQGIPVGPGRGSGAGSIVAYALRITDIDPIPYNLLFERFLNPERVSMPDFDVDFCQDRRDEVIRYVAEKYGASNVAQITTFGKMNARAIVRHVGRVLELGYGRVDRIAKLVPEELGITLADAIAKEPRINEECARDEMVADLMRLARELEGLASHTSVHAAGIVISDGPMTDYVPVYTTPGAGLITQYEMKMAEKVGLIKFDFLGLKTLTVIEKAIEILRLRGEGMDIALIPMDDKGVFKIISDGHCIGIFQLESSGMRALVTKLKPSCFEDIIAVVALFRPGPLGSGMVDDFIERKHGRQEIIYPLPQLEPILKETYGIILYQEQVMKIAGELASYSLGEADLLRRAMGKKNPAEMEKQKSRFVSGAIGNGIDESKAAEIFDLMAEFANYGFNKSHSAAYGLVSYQTAYLKAHFPAEFMAAIMTCDLDNTKKIVRYVDECRRMQLKILPLDINRSSLDFDVPSPGTIGFALAAIKGIGREALKPLIDQREANGPYADLSDLAVRVNLQKVGKKTLELLVQAGAFDSFGISRPKLCTLIEPLFKFSENFHQARSAGQRGLFDDAPAEDGACFDWSSSLTEIDRKTGAADPEGYRKEKALLGVFLTGHPLDFHKEDIKAFGKAAVRDLPNMLKKSVSIVAVLAATNERLTKNNTRMASFRLEDQTGAIEAIAFEKDMPPEIPEIDTIVVATLGIDMSFDGQSLRVKLERIEPLEEKRREHVKAVTLRITPPSTLLSGKPGAITSAVELLKSHISTHAGDTPLKLTICYEKADIDIDLSHQAVDLSDAFLHGLSKLPFSSTHLALQLF